jgi:hypothetical protein
MGQGTAALIDVSPLAARYTIFTYLYVNTSDFDNAADRPPWTDAARIHAASKSSNNKNG